MCTAVAVAAYDGDEFYEKENLHMRHTEHADETTGRSPRRPS